MAPLFDLHCVESRKTTCPKSWTNSVAVDYPKGIQHIKELFLEDPRNKWVFCSCFPNRLCCNVFQNTWLIKDATHNLHHISRLQEANPAWRKQDDPEPNIRLSGFSVWCRIYRRRWSEVQDAFNEEKLIVWQKCNENKLGRGLERFSPDPEGIW